MCERIEESGGNKAADSGQKPSSPLAEFGPLDSCRAIMRAYEKYRYNLFKEKCEKHGSITR
ncbi:MAG: hypothetical protein J1G01_00145 [Clostridiales bacterium]|nr:hypothetical protein [Clostridiales bacterium]